ncbi:MAG TPA: hypothetical protein VHD69_02170 [Candidatus Paceibacterota bacterium]|nr:hypothetical protein [Candidatus Paceibacterota bacterium]
MALLAFAEDPFHCRIYRSVDDKGKSHFSWKTRQGLFGFRPLRKLPPTRFACLWYEGRRVETLAFVSPEEVAAMEKSMNGLAKEFNRHRG